MQPLPDTTVKQIMLFVQHPLVDRMRPNFEPTELGVIINANNKFFLARNNSNPTMEEYYDAYVYDHVMPIIMPIITPMIIGFIQD